MRNWIVIGLGFVIVLSMGCKKIDIAPVANMLVNSHYGYPGRVFTFSASGSTDGDNEAIGLMCRWDFESDGIWDTPFTRTHEVNHSFSFAGTFTVTLEVMDPAQITNQVKDTIHIYGPLPDSTIIDSRDNQSYRVVKTNHLWIMAENLKCGKMILTEQEQTDNHQIEYYAYNNDPNSVNEYGGLYSWWEAMNYNNHTYNRGICPQGWRIPDVEDILKINIPASHYFIVDYYRKGGISGLNIDFPGLYEDRPISIPNNSTGPIWGFPGYVANFWTTFYQTQQIGGLLTLYKIGKFSFYNTSYDFPYHGNGVDLTPYYIYEGEPDGYYERFYISVRCVKDEL